MPIPSTSGLAAVVGGEKLKAQPNQAFFLYHYPGEPGDWALAIEGLEKPTWVPSLRPFFLEPGVSNVRTLEAGEDPASAYDQAIVSLQRQGASVYLPDLEAFQITDKAHLPDGVEAGAYIRATPTAGGGNFYHLAHELIDNPRRPGQRHRQKTDDASYHRWLVHLMESGAVAPPEDDVIADRIELQRGKLRSAQVDTTANSSVRDSAVSKHAERLQAMESAVVAKPARRRGK